MALVKSMLLMWLVLMTAGVTPTDEIHPEPQTARISHYCNCVVCCGKWYTPQAIGAGGIPLEAGKHIAATKDIPLWSTVIIDDKEYIVADRVADWIYKKYGTCVDVYMGTDHTGALKAGVQQKEVIVYGAE